jgi:hypothetical protein
MDIIETELKDVDWINPAQNRYKWPALANMINIRTSCNVKKFLIS